MIEKYRFKKKKPAAYFAHMSAFMIDSIVTKGLMYGIDGGKFYIIRSDGFCVCELSEVPQLASRLKPEVKKEVLDIYEDVKDYKRMDIDYENPMISLYAMVRS